MKMVSFIVGLFMLAQGVYFAHDAWLTHGTADRTETALLAAGKVDDLPVLSEQRGILERYKALLEQRLLAINENPEVFQERLETTLGAVGLDTVQAWPWTPVDPETTPPIDGAAAYERVIEVEGSFAAVVDFLRSVERWPDEPRARTLELEPVGAGRVRASMTLVVLRATKDLGEELRSNQGGAPGSAGAPSGGGS